MCILCVLQKWAPRVATMLMWLVIPLIGLWAVSRQLPPAFQFEITTTRLACVLVLVVTVLWYKILMPRLSAWRARRNAWLREKKRFEAIELQKLRKTATKKCRNCLTPYRDQNPGGGKFMCLYCGHVSKRPVLDLPVPPGLELSLNRKVCSDNGWMFGQELLENGNWAAGSFAGKSSSRRGNTGGFFDDDHCSPEKSYSRLLMFACRAFTTFVLAIPWLWKRISWLGSSRDDALMEAERRRMLDKRYENGGNCQESRGEKARRKAEERRQARLEKELMEEEERKQREEVARLVEERRRLRDEKMESEKETQNEYKKQDNRKDIEKKQLKKKKERDRLSSKSNSDAEESDKKASKENDRSRQNESDLRNQQRARPENVKVHNTDMGHAYKGAGVSNNYRGYPESRYLDRMKDSFLSSSRAFTRGSFFGKGANNMSREHKPNTSADHVQHYANRKEPSRSERTSTKTSVTTDDKIISRPVLVESQPPTTPKKSWQQLFTRSSSPPSSSVISRPKGKLPVEVHSPLFGHPSSRQAFDTPISFAPPSPFMSSPFTVGSATSSTSLPLSSESMFPRIGERPQEIIAEESEVFEDPCYVPDPVALLGPVSESLNDFQLDLGFVEDTGSGKRCATVPSEINRPSPIESPMSQLRVSEEKYSNPFSSAVNQDLKNPSTDGSNTNDTGTWQMWNSSPFGQDGLGLIGGVANWLLHPEQKRSSQEEVIHPFPQKTMASLFKKDDQVLSGNYSSQMVYPTTFQNDRSFGTSMSAAVSAGLDTQCGMSYSVCATDHHLEPSSANCWDKKDGSIPGSGVGNLPLEGPPISGPYPSPNV